MSTTWLGFALHLVGVVSRAIAAGRVPWANMYEFSILFTLVAMVIFLAMQRGRDMRFLGAFVLGPVLLMLGVAVAVLYVRADGVQPALQSYWLIIHVSVATMAVGVFSIAATLSVIQLIQDRAELRHVNSARPAPRADGPPHGATTAVTQEKPQTSRRSVWGRLLDVVPSSDELERLAYRLNAVGFIMWTFTLIAGAIWAEHAWGRPWGWDPKEVWTFVIWVIYAAYLHARATRGWEGRRAAYLSTAGFAAILGNYFIVNLIFNSKHGYSGIG